MTTVWGVLAAIALLWPDRVLSPLDGIPLDGAFEAIAVGVVLPFLFLLHRSFLRTRRARVAIVALLAWRAGSSLLLTQEGWCVRFDPARPYVWDQTGAPHAWDVRADWRSADPACSAVMTRPYEWYRDFPAWFFNLPPPDNGLPRPEDRPPEATTRLTIRGFVQVDDPGVLRLATGPRMAPRLTIDGIALDGDARLARGVHQINLEATLVGTQWRVSPTWNGADLFRTTLTTIRRPSSLDALARRWLWVVPALFGLTLLGMWSAAAAVALTAPAAFVWSTALSLLIGWLVVHRHADLARLCVAATMLGALMPIRSRVRNERGMLLLVGVPWLTWIVVSAVPAIGRWTLYEAGDDFWTFQRFAYRIAMQGYWLEGGTPTFWFQPLYRWIAAVLHLVFGDSSVGEAFWDGGCLLAGSLLSYRVARRIAGFRAGIVAGALALATFVFGTAQYLVGRGLGELSSAGFISAAALLAMRSRHRSSGYAAAAGVLAVLAFYTRLNNLIMAAGVTLFALLPAAMPIWGPWRWRGPGRRASAVTAMIIPGVIGVGVLLFAWRTWHYTGVFSVFYGTQRDLLAIWQPHLPLRTVAERAIGSAMMVLTVNDPPRFDPYALPVLVGAAAALLATLGVPRVRRLPAAPVLFLYSGLAGALLARGSAYAGRFSVHLIPIACALTVGAARSIISPSRSMR
jgi:hypothetical protein